MNANISDLIPAGPLNTKQRLNASMDIKTGVLDARRGKREEVRAVPGIEGWEEAGDGTVGLEELDRGDAGTDLASPGEQRADLRTETDSVVKKSHGAPRVGRNYGKHASNDKRLQELSRP